MVHGAVRLRTRDRHPDVDVANVESRRPTLGARPQQRGTVPRCNTAQRLRLGGESPDDAVIHCVPGHVGHTARSHLHAVLRVTQKR